MIAASILAPFLAAISLGGVSGEQLSARASFDANNVRVGDPMTLTVDFIGSAEFSDLHPPALSREVDRRIWKVDDASAKTDTYLNARRLVYRVRPLKEGLWEFPALEFEYEGPARSQGADVRRCSTGPVPVHVKPGMQAALAGLDDARDDLPMPDGLMMDAGGRGLSDDELFAWRKACGAQSAKAFAAFDFPEARLNEAACETLAGNWARALKIYSALEWRTGQTGTIERGIVAALARKTGDAAQELPAWRQAFRPVLRHSAAGRIGIVAGCLLVLTLVLWLCGRAIRSLAALAAVLLAASALPASAQSMFDELERMHQQMMEQMNSMMGSPGMSMGGSGVSFSIGGRQQEPVEILADVAVSTKDVRVGETFRFLVSLEAPKSATLDQIRFTPSEMFGMVVMGKVEALADGVSSNPSNRVRRLAVPVRYDVPFKGDMTFRVEGMVSQRQVSGRSSFSFSRNFAVDSPAIPVEIKPLPSDGQPPDFSGAIGTGFSLVQSADRTRVETNDVVRLTCTIDFSGYLPPGAVPDELERRPGHVVWRRYFIADGARTVPPLSLVYYDTATRGYKTAVSRPVALSYVAEAELEAEAVAVDAGGEKGSRALVLRFAPSDSAAIVARTAWCAGEGGGLKVTETRGDWVRVDDGAHAGWTRKEGLE